MAKINRCEEIDKLQIFGVLFSIDLCMVGLDFHQKNTLFIIPYRLVPFSTYLVPHWVLLHQHFFALIVFRRPNL